MEKMYKDGIDFVTISYGQMYDYVRLLVKSIDKYFDGVPYTIWVIVNYINEEEIEINKNLFKDNPNVKVIKGCDQASTTQIKEEGQVIQTQTRIGLIDQCEVGMGGYYGSWATNKGIKLGSRKYVCVLDQDAIFLDKYACKLMDACENVAFISNRWCPGSVFKSPISKGTCGGTWIEGIARTMLFFSKRSFYDDLYKEKYVENGIWQFEPFNVDFRDIGGNLTWHCLNNDLPIAILKNSYRDEYRKDENLWKLHVINIPYGEQAWLNGIPIFFHATRGGYRKNKALDLWVNEVENYLK